MKEKINNFFSWKIIIGVLLVQLIWTIYLSIFINKFGQLPAPFFYDKTDTFMDLYNPLYWASLDGIYSEWKSVYPPINFIFLKALRFIIYDGVDISNSFELRINSICPVYIFVAIYFSAIVYIVNSLEWQGLLNIKKILIIFIIITLTPFLFALERGNLIVLCLFLLPIILRSNSLVGIVFLSIAINIKPYFAFLLIGYLISGSLEKFCIGIFLSGFIFLSTGLLIDQNFLLLIPNLLNFGSSNEFLSGNALLSMPISVLNFSHVINIYLQSNVLTNEVSNLLMMLEVLIKLINYIFFVGFGIIIICCRYKINESEILVGLIVALVSCIMSVGSYSIIFYLIIIPYLLNMRLYKIHIILVGLIFSPSDMIIFYSKVVAHGEIFISNAVGEHLFQLSVGTIIRPLISLLLIISLSFDFLTRGIQKRELLNV